MDLADIHNSNVKMAEHWRKLAGLIQVWFLNKNILKMILQQKKYIEELKKRTNQDRIQLEQKAAIKIQVLFYNKNHKPNIEYIFNRFGGAEFVAEK